MSKTTSTPWLIPLAERKKVMDLALSEHKKLALLLYPSPDGSTFRYRGYNLYKACLDSKDWQLIYFFNNEIAELEKALPFADILILCRQIKWSATFDNLANTAHHYGAPVLMDVDDCICGLNNIREMINTVALDEVDQEYWIKACANCEMISQSVDGFITTNDYLGKLLSETHNNKPFYTIPNTLNDEQIQFSEALVEQKKDHSDYCTLGYFSGSHTHAADFDVVYQELLDLLLNNPNIRLEIVGMMSLPNAMEQLIKTGQVIRKPLVDFLTLQRYISEVDINLVPLVNNTFTNCKSELKFFESAIVDVPTIASPVYTYATSITDKETGFLCGPGEWTDAILKLSEDSKLRKQIATNAKKYCLERYSPKACQKITEEVFGHILKDLA